MRKLALTAILALAASPAFADTTSGLYAGGQIGYHDTGSILGQSIDGLTYGGYVGVNRELSGPFVVGAEGNYSFSSGDLDSEYGFNAHAGVKFGKSALAFVRAGYQWVDFDLVHIAEDGLGRPLTAPELAIIDGQDDTDGGFLTGAGLQFGIGERASIRTVVDTIEFETVKVSAGFALHF